MVSRSNPFKTKRRSAKTTLLVFGEGSAEKTFLDHLKFCYGNRDGGTAITIKQGRGGTPLNIVRDAMQIRGAFDQIVVIIDNDKSEEEMNEARTEAERYGIKLIEHTPCLEAVLLAILNPGRSFVGKTSEWCKHEFQSKHIDRKKRGDPEEYKKLFPKSLLDNVKKKVGELAEMIEIITKTN